MFTITRSDSETIEKTSDYATFNFGIQENDKPLVIGLYIQPGQSLKDGIEVDVYRADEDVELSDANCRRGEIDQAPFAFLSHYSTKNQTMEFTFQITDTVTSTLIIYHTNAYLLAGIFPEKGAVPREQKPKSDTRNNFDDGPSGGWPKFDSSLQDDNDEEPKKKIKSTRVKKEKADKIDKYEASARVDSKKRNKIEKLDKIRQEPKEHNVKQNRREELGKKAKLEKREKQEKLAKEKSNKNKLENDKLKKDKLENNKLKKDKTSTENKKQKNSALTKVIKDKSKSNKDHATNKKARVKYMLD